MAEAAGADRMAVGVLRDVVNDVVIVRGTDPGRNVVEVERVPDFPGDNVVGAGGVAAHTEGAHDFALAVVQSQPAPQHLPPPDFFAYHPSIALASQLQRSPYAYPSP